MVSGTPTQIPVFSRAGGPEWGGKEATAINWELSLGHSLMVSHVLRAGRGGDGSAKMSLLRASLLHIQCRQIYSLPGTVRRGLCSTHGCPGEPGKRDAVQCQGGETETVLASLEQMRGMPSG